MKRSTLAKPSTKKKARTAQTWTLDSSHTLANPETSGQEDVSSQPPPQLLAQAAQTQPLSASVVQDQHGNGKTRGPKAPPLQPQAQVAQTQPLVPGFVQIPQHIAQPQLPLLDLHSSSDEDSEEDQMEGAVAAHLSSLLPQARTMSAVLPPCLTEAREHVGADPALEHHVLLPVRHQRSWYPVNVRLSNSLLNKMQWTAYSVAMVMIGVLVHNGIVEATAEDCTCSADQVAALEKRISILENVEKINKQRLCTLETQEGDNRQNIVALESAETSYQYRLESVETSQTNNLQRLTDLENKTTGLSTTVGFYASVSRAKYTLGPHETIVFGRVITNQGHAYDVSTGEFTAPMDGTYFFSGTILSAPNAVIETGMKVNGVIKVWLYSGGKWHGSGSSVAIFELAEGDVVTMAKNGPYGTTPYYVHPSWSSFSGFLIRPKMANGQE